MTDASHEQNDFFVSTIHRVINETGRERYSAPFFMGFNRNCLLTPVPTCVTPDNPAKYRVITVGEYQLWRARKFKMPELVEEEI